MPMARLTPIAAIVPARRCASRAQGRAGADVGADQDDERLADANTIGTCSSSRRTPTP